MASAAFSGPLLQMEGLDQPEGTCEYPPVTAAPKVPPPVREKLHLFLVLSYMNHLLLFCFSS